MKFPGLTAIVIGCALLTPRAIHTPASVRLASALRSGSVAEVDALLRRGADANARLENGTTPLEYAILTERRPVIAVLLARGADPNASDHGMSMLSLLVQTKPCPTATVSALLAAGADPNRHDAPSARTPLLRALHAGAPACAKILLDHGARIDARDVAGGTALDAAVAGSSPRVVEGLIRRGIAVNATMARGVTPLMWAALRQPDRREVSESVIAVLLDHGADPCMQDADAMTAADYARKMGFTARASRLASACTRWQRDHPRKRRRA